MTLQSRTIGRFGPPGRRGALLLACAAAVVLAACSSTSGARSVASLPRGSAGTTATTPALSQSQGDQDMVDFADAITDQMIVKGFLSVTSPAHEPAHVSSR